MYDWPVVLDPVARSVPWTVIQSRAWERELCWFIWVPKVILFLRAVAKILTKTWIISINVMIYSESEAWTVLSVSPSWCAENSSPRWPWDLARAAVLFHLDWSLCPVCLHPYSAGPWGTQYNANNKINTMLSSCKLVHLKKSAAYSTWAPHCRSPQSWQWQCKTTCPSSPRSRWRDVSGLAGWCLDSPHCPENERMLNLQPKLWIITLWLQ